MLQPPVPRLRRLPQDTVHALHFSSGDWLLEMHFLLIKMLKIKLHVKRFVKI